MIAQPPGIIRRLFLAALAAMAMAGCAAGPDDRQDRVGVPATGVGSRAAGVALQQVGTPYRYGGNSPSGFDCSGLVQYSYAVAGKRVPRTTTAQWRQLSSVDRDDMQAGDVLFFRIAGKMSHVGLYLGGGRFVHAPSSGRSVSVESLGSAFYRDAFIRAGRPY